MYKVKVHYSKGGMEAFTAKAANIDEARAKAAHIKSQGFHVEISAADGSPLLVEE